jgi:hypothetical protein
MSLDEDYGEEVISKRPHTERAEVLAVVDGIFSQGKVWRHKL